MRSWPHTVLQLKSTSRNHNLGNSVPEAVLAPTAGTQTGRI
jgi:hypothetical protein